MHFTLSQTQTPIAFTHDKFITVINRMIISPIKNQLEEALDKWPMVSIFQLLLRLVTVDSMVLAVVQGSNQMVLQNLTTLKHSHKWIAIMLQNGDPIVAPSTLITHIRQMLSHGSQILINEWMKSKINYYCAENKGSAFNFKKLRFLQKSQTVFDCF